jgi:type II secretory pathway pseudopilin PulG
LKTIEMKERGFTIAELLVAATISILIVALLGVMFGSILKTTSRTSASIDAFRDARAALATMKRDLSAVVAAKPGAYFALDVDGAGNVGAVNFAALRQIAALISLKNQQGDLCAVRYYCGWDGKAYSLKRFFRDSTSTAQVFRTLYNSNGYADLGQLYCSNIANCATAAYARPFTILAVTSLTLLSIQGAMLQLTFLTSATPPRRPRRALLQVPPRLLPPWKFPSKQ